jgi:hypothetical protein
MDGDKSLSRFDVAIWRCWPPGEELPLIGVVSASDAAAAVVAVMQVYGLTRAAHVAAGDQERRFVHRAYGVCLAEEESAFVQKASNG